MASFHGVLRGLREKGGHRTPRSFFHALGGTRFFGCTYRQYYNVEAGKSFPSPRLLERIAAGLRLGHDLDASREFLLSYLRALWGGDDLVTLLLESLPGRAVSEGDQGHFRRAVRRHFNARSYPLSRQQSDFLHASPENYWAFTLLSNDTGAWEPAELARAADLDPRKVERALRSLERLKLVKRGRDGRYRCPLTDRVFLHPRERIHAHGANRMRAHMLALSERRGGVVAERPLLIRASEQELRAYLPQLADAVRGADLFSTVEKGPDTAFFLVEAAVRKLLPF